MHVDARRLVRTRSYYRFELHPSRYTPPSLSPAAPDNGKRLTLKRSPSFLLISEFRSSLFFYSLYLCPMFSLNHALQQHATRMTHVTHDHHPRPHRCGAAAHTHTVFIGFSGDKQRNVSTALFVRSVLLQCCA
jgi:hypothetical protein